MSPSTIDLVLHPARMRVLMALAGRERTPAQLNQALSDIPLPSLYRHINRLAEAGLIQVVAEQPVRGTVEKTYGLAPAGHSLSPEEMSKLSKDDHMRVFVGFIASLLDDFSRYLENSPEVDLVADGVGYRKAAIELNDEELPQLSHDLNQALLPYLQNPTSPDRRRRILTTILVPDPLPVSNSNDEPSS